MRKLLIADDEEGIRNLVRLTVGDDEIEILEASDGEEALSLAREAAPEVVLLDVMMPKLSGFEVCRALKDDPATRDITIVMLTSMAQEADLDNAAAAGANDYFTKPFSPVALINKLDEIFDGPG